MRLVHDSFECCERRDDVLQTGCRVRVWGFGFRIECCERRDDVLQTGFRD